MTIEDIKKLLSEAYNHSCFLSVAELYQFTGEREYKHIGEIDSKLIKEIIQSHDIESFNNNNMHLFFSLKEKNKEGRGEPGA